MRIDVRWQSQQGTNTADNRDCAAIGVRNNGFLAIIVDGSTKGKSNGDYAHALAHAIVDWFADSSDPMTADALTAMLRKIHAMLFRHFPRNSASYLIVSISAGDAMLVAHAGDCVLGQVDHTGINHWMTAPHTLANALVATSLDELAKEKGRHLLTRSFRSREFIPPEIRQFTPIADVLLAATDGFWGELEPADQSSFLDGKLAISPGERDDRSALVVKLSKNGVSEFELYDEDVAGNLYVRRGH